MAQFSGNSLSVPRAFADAVVRWRRAQFPAMMREVIANLTGRMMKRQSGKTLANVISKSRELPLGFKVATTSPSLIAWMEGSRRKGFWVFPKGRQVLRRTRTGFTTRARKGARALRFVVNGRVVFSAGHYIPPWRFRPTRPVIENAFQRRQERMLAGWGREAQIAMKELFPDKKRKVVVNF